MGSRGTPPTPTRVLELHGSRKHKQQRRHWHEPQLPNVVPPVPDWLEDGRARRRWEFVASLLQKAGVITEIDGEALARYCEIFELWIECKDEINANGMTYTTVDQSGNQIERARRSVGLIREYSAELLRLEQQFGLTPSARTRLQANKVDQQVDEFEAFLAKKRQRGQRKQG